MNHWLLTANAGADSGFFLGDAGLGDLVHSGNSALYFAALGEPALDLFTQTISTVVAATYHLTYWLSSTSFGVDPFNAFDVRWNNVSIVAASLTDAADFDFREFSFFVTAASTTSTLSFGGRNAPGFVILDDVSLTTGAGSPTVVPEPASLLLLGAGLAVGARRFRRRAA